jgi:broad specificity phosphatase PhoE
MGDDGKSPEWEMMVRAANGDRRQTVEGKLSAYSRQPTAGSRRRAAKEQAAVGCGLLALLTSMVLTPPSTALAQSTHGRALNAATSGGVILLCRHAITGNFSEQEPVAYSDSTTQRLLAPEGERQSGRMGRAFRSLDIPVAGVVASPMHRARRTAELMFDPATIEIDSIWHTNGSEFTGPAVEARRRVLRTPLENGNLIIISHIGTMGNALGESPGEVGEGDCVVVRPRGNDFEVIGVVKWREWESASGHEP